MPPDCVWPLDLGTVIAARNGKQYTYARPRGVFVGDVIHNYHTLAVSPNYPILTSRLYFSVHHGGSVSRLP
jgi:hypothetical protein